MTGEWKKVSPGSITSWKSGGTPGKGSHEYWNGPIPWFGANSIHGSRFASSASKITARGLTAGSNGLAGNGKLRHLDDRTRRELSDDDIARIAATYHAWRGDADAGAYQDIPGFCKSTKLEDIRGHNHVLTPGRYVGAEEAEEDDVPLAERFAGLRAKLEKQFAEADRLAATIRTKLAEVGADE